MYSVSLPSTSSPVGYGVTSPGQLAPPSPLLADNIDPQTHDYVSLFRSIDPIDAQVIIALKIVKGSGAAVEDDGSRFRDIRKITQSVKTEIKSEVRRALARLIANRDIKYKGVAFDVFDPSNRTIQARVQWVNLRAFDGAVKSASISFSAGGV